MQVAGDGPFLKRNGWTEVRWTSTNLHHDCFLMLSEDLAHRAGDFAQRSVTLSGIENRWHEVRSVLSCFFHSPDGRLPWMAISTQP